MHQISILFIAFIFNSIGLQGQNVSGIYNKNNVFQLKPIQLPKQDNDKLAKAELKLRKSGRANHFATGIEVKVNPLEDGKWTEDGDLSIWQYRVQSEGAYSLNFGFSRYAMPANGKLLIYTIDKSDSIGPFDVKDNDTHKELWTPVVFGDDIILEIQIPTEKKENLDILLKSINHDFMDIRKSLVGSCNVDVACDAENGYAEIDNYRDNIESVGAYTLNGISQCSGALINNARFDCRPYFLTADHCSVRKFNSASVVIYWDYQNSFCREPNTPESSSQGDGQLIAFNSGTKLIARSINTDFTLLELDDPVSPSTTPYFSGWDKRRQIWNPSVCVHHPGVKEKRISMDNSPITYHTQGNGDTLFLRVENWDIGTTEGGSSGAPLFNKENRIIGQLFGGQASCGNDLWDNFGWIRSSWEGGGTPETRLKDWLDPDNSGLSFIDGNSCIQIVSLNSNSLEYCTQHISNEVFQVSINNEFATNTLLSVLELPQALRASFSNNPIMPGTSTNLQIHNLDQLSNGSYFFTVVADDGRHTSKTVLNLSVNNDSPTAVQLLSPQNGTLVSSFNTKLKWEDNATSFKLQVAEDKDFGRLIVNETNLIETQYALNGLVSEQDYYWRVKARNYCGYNDWSNANSFTIDELNCFRIEAQDVPLIIGTSSTERVVSSILIEEEGIIKDINILEIKGKHSWLSDIEIHLKSPSGEEIVLINKSCEGGENFDVSFDDDAETNEVKCPYNDASSYIPVSPLSHFVGENIHGVWELIIIDEELLDGGELQSWNIEFCIKEFLSTPSVALSKDSIDICDESSVELTIHPSVSFIDSIQFSIKNPISDVNAQFSPEIVAAGESSTLILSGVDNLSIGEYITTILTKSKTLTVENDLLLAVVSNTSTSLISPFNQENEVSLKPTFKWQPVPNAQNYILQVSKNEAYSSFIINENITGNSFVFTTSLDTNTQYYWRVITVFACEQTISSSNNFNTILNSAVKDIELLGILISPNPSIDKLIIDFKDFQYRNAEIELLTLEGKRIYTGNVKNGAKKVEIDVHQFPSGLYYFRLAMLGNTYFKKITILH